MRVSSRGY
ncbi:hypothetical protein D030_0227A, partial [Vibrio parahaemolyticus AQ3810]